MTAHRLSGETIEFLASYQTVCQIFSTPLPLSMSFSYMMWYFDNIHSFLKQKNTIIVVQYPQKLNDPNKKFWAYPFDTSELWDGKYSSVLPRTTNQRLFQLPKYWPSFVKYPSCSVFKVFKSLMMNGDVEGTGSVASLSLDLVLNMT